MTTPTRIYVATVSVGDCDPVEHLVEAATKAQTKNFVAEKIISVRVASPSEVYALAQQGVAMEKANGQPTVDEESDEETPAAES